MASLFVVREHQRRAGEFICRTCFREQAPKQRLTLQENTIHEMALSSFLHPLRSELNGLPKALRKCRLPASGLHARDLRLLSDVFRLFGRGYEGLSIERGLRHLVRGGHQPTCHRWGIGL